MVLDSDLNLNKYNHSFYPNNIFSKKTQTLTFRYFSYFNKNFSLNKVKRPKRKPHFIEHFFTKKAVLHNAERLF